MSIPDQNQRKLDLYFLSVISLYSFVLCCFSICEGHDWGDDFALYLQQAQCLLSDCSKNLLLQNKFLTDNSEGIIGPYFYPIGFPLLLSPLLFFFKFNLIVFKAFTAFLFVLSLPVIYFVFKKTFNNLISSKIHLIFIAVNPAFIFFSDNVLSDLPFILFFYTSLFLMLNKDESHRNYFLAGMAMAAATLTRDMGILLFPTFVMHKLIENKILKKDRPYLIEWAPKVLIILLFLVLSYKVNQVYTSNSGEVFKLILDKVSFNYSIENFVFYANAFANLFGFGNIVGSILMIFSVLGFFLLLRSHISLGFLFCIFLLVHFILPFRDLRYIFPLAPLYFLFFILGLGKVLHFFNWRTSLALSVLAFFFVVFSFKDIFYNKVTCNNEALSNEINEIYTYIKCRTPLDAIIFFDKPRALRLFTDRNAVNSSNYNVVNSLKTKYLISKNENELNEDLFKLEFCNKTYCLYKIIK